MCTLTLDLIYFYLYILFTRMLFFFKFEILFKRFKYKIKRIWPL